MIATLVLGSPAWVLPATILSVVAFVVLCWGYLRAGTSPVTKLCAALLKTLGIVALAICLIEPLFSGVRPRPGANLFLLLADNSQSLQLHDAGAKETRGQRMHSELTRKSQWRARLEQDFDVRRYFFDTRLRPVANFDELSFDGNGTSVVGSLDSVSKRFRDRPQAGVLLVTDGNATDIVDDEAAWEEWPPVYPVIVGSTRAGRDISIQRVDVTQTNFEAAPVTVRAEIATVGFAQERIVVEMVSPSGEVVEKQTVQVDDDRTLKTRFTLRPESTGIEFYQLRVAAEDHVKDRDTPADGDEATLANNTRLVMIDRGGGPYRILYVCGRPNWEFKFLRRALDEDEEIDLVGLVRIARREPKFNFLSRRDESTNPLFRGFENPDEEQAERYDQPVLLRLGTRDEAELRDGFPKAADQLYEYHAVVLDDLERDFFTHDQMAMLQKFVSLRGGGLLMLGGQESFSGGQFMRTPIGDMLPVYLDRLPAGPEDASYRLSLTREGWLQPWVRVRKTEDEERRRLLAMPDFQTLNRSAGIKPGATVLASVREADGTEFPALVEQRFGKGKSAALLIGDLWRWELRRPSNQEQRDLRQAWRQTIRWLVADVPGRIEVDLQRTKNDSLGPVSLRVQVRGVTFEPLDNASVVAVVTAPDGGELKLKAEPVNEASGVFTASYSPRLPGAYRAKIDVTAADGSDVGSREVGWAAEPAADEFRELEPNRQLLEKLAKKTRGEVLELDELDDFVDDLPNRKIPVVEPWIYPLWHQPMVFFFAILCLTAEWGLRRWKGLP